MKILHTTIIESQNIKECFKQAFQIASAELCLGKIKNKENCKCDSCRKIKTGNHPDFILIEKPNDKKNISVEQIRKNLIAKINSRPLLSKAIVIIIKNAHHLSIGAQNALLKTLEEPPSYVKILLTVDDRRHLLETITSRSQIYKISSTKQESASSFKKITEIINLDLPKRFELAKEIVDKDKKEDRKDSFYTLEFIDLLIIGLRELLKNNLNNSKLQSTIIKDLNKILEDKVKIHYNTNKLLVLENLMLQTLDSQIYKTKDV